MNPLLNPLDDLPRDRELSPYTGLTRAHWEHACDVTLHAVRPYATPGHSLIALPGPASGSGELSDGFEGFARTFLAAAFRLARPEAGAGDLAEWYAEGLCAGVDGKPAERWPTQVAVRQARVEAASLALALHETRDQIWQHLPGRVQQRLVEWLADAVGQRDAYPDNNWQWFFVIVQTFLRSVGGPWSAEDIEHTLARHESWYCGGGWYSDGTDGSGQQRNFDWYVGWALHLYPLWYCRMAGDDAPAGLLDRYRQRLREYLTGTQHLVSPDGAPLYQGRSLTYRYAITAPFWMGALFDAGALPPGRTRRLASGVLDHFLRRGALDGKGLQPIGWHGAFPLVRQPYSGPASPYWSSKAFSGLVLPADHPVWSDIEEPFEVEGGDVAVSLPGPGWLVSATRRDGVVRVVNHGGDRYREDRLGVDDAFYARIGYSSHAAPDCDPGVGFVPAESHVALVDAQGAVSHRRPLRRLHVGDRVAASRHVAHWLDGPAPVPFAGRHDRYRLRTGPQLVVCSALRGAIEVRVVKLEPPTGEAFLDEDGELCLADAGPWTLVLAGYRLAGDAPNAAVATASEVTAGGLVSAVVPLRGLRAAEPHRRDGVNPMGERSACPLAVSVGPVQVGEVYAAAVVLSADRTQVDRARMITVDFVVSDVDVVRVEWPDGPVDEVPAR